MNASDMLTTRARTVLELAKLEAEERGHDYIGTEHLLLALIRENEGIAAGVLAACGVSDRIPKALDFIIGRKPSPPTDHVVRLRDAYQGPAS
jgi:ATP-dependent Clp protease ATP-binding subunit ClpC